VSSPRGYRACTPVGAAEVDGWPYRRQTQQLFFASIVRLRPQVGILVCAQLAVVIINLVCIYILRVVAKLLGVLQRAGLVFSKAVYILVGRRRARRSGGAWRPSARARGRPPPRMQGRRRSQVARPGECAGGARGSKRPRWLGSLLAPCKVH